MGEQNRRAVELEHPPGEAAPPAPPAGRSSPRDPDAGRALSPEADERQTRRQAPDGAWPGEGAEDDSIG
jgi:hypothetical protein